MGEKVAAIQKTARTARLNSTDPGSIRFACSASARDAEFTDRHAYSFRPNISFNLSASARSCSRTVFLFIR